MPSSADPRSRRPAGRRRPAGGHGHRLGRHEGLAGVGRPARRPLSTPSPAGPVLPDEVTDVLRRAGLVDDPALGQRMRPAVPRARRNCPAGVSSDIWRVDLPAGPVCVKRARARLKVGGHLGGAGRAQRRGGRLPAGGGAGRAGPRAPPAGPRSGGPRARAGMARSGHPPGVEADLLEGRVDPQVVEMLGRILAAIHAATAPTRRSPPASTTPRSSPPSASTLTSRPTARAHPDLAGPLHARREAIESTGGSSSTATSARRTSSSGPTGRCCSTPSAPRSATPRSISPSASTTCC